MLHTFFLGLFQPLSFFSPQSFRLTLKMNFNSRWQVGYAEHFIQCIALRQYLIHWVNSNTPSSCLPYRVIIGSYCYCIYIDTWLMEFSGAISPECQSPLRGFFGILIFYLEWMDQLFRIFHRRLWGQIIFFMCNLYKSQDKITWIWIEN